MLNIIKLLFEIVEIIVIVLLEKGLLDESEKTFKEGYDQRIMRRLKKCRKHFKYLDELPIKRARKKGLEFNVKLKNSADK